MALNGPFSHSAKSGSHPFRPLEHLEFPVLQLPIDAMAESIFEIVSNQPGPDAPDVRLLRLNSGRSGLPLFGSRPCIIVNIRVQGLAAEMAQLKQA